MRLFAVCQISILQDRQYAAPDRFAGARFVAWSDICGLAKISL
jgi:hypothetical protein